MNRCMCETTLKNFYFAFAYYEDNKTLFLPPPLQTQAIMCAKR